jgi:hypothetical protein
MSDIRRFASFALACIVACALVMLASCPAEGQNLQLPVPQQVLDQYYAQNDMPRWRGCCARGLPQRIITGLALTPAVAIEAPPLETPVAVISGDPNAIAAIMALWASSGAGLPVPVTPTVVHVETPSQCPACPTCQSPPTPQPPPPATTTAFPYGQPQDLPEWPDGRLRQPVDQGGGGFATGDLVGLVPGTMPPKWSVWQPGTGPSGTRALP